MCQDSQEEKLLAIKILSIAHFLHWYFVEASYVFNLESFKILKPPVSMLLPKGGRTMYYLCHREHEIGLPLSTAQDHVLHQLEV